MPKAVTRCTSTGHGSRRDNSICDPWLVAWAGRAGGLRPCTCGSIATGRISRPEYDVSATVTGDAAQLDDDPHLRAQRSHYWLLPRRHRPAFRPRRGPSAPIDCVAVSMNGGCPWAAGAKRELAPTRQTHIRNCGGLAWLGSQWAPTDRGRPGGDEIVDPAISRFMVPKTGELRKFFN